MRTRRWILVIALLMAFTVLVTYHGWNLLKVNERIKEYVIFKIKPALGGEFQIQKLDMSLGAVHLKNVKIKDNDFSLVIEDIRIGFNFINLLKNNFVPQRIPHDILLIQPQLTIIQNPLKRSRPLAPDSNALQSKPIDYWKKIKDLDFIKRITISKGKINYLDSTSQQHIQLVHEINGWLNAKDKDLILARLVGKLFKSKSFNLLLTSTVDVAHHNLDSLEAKIANFEWQEKIPIIIPKYFDIKHGTVDGSISLIKSDSTGKNFDLRGTVSITNGFIQISGKGLNFENINIKANIAERNCSFENSGFMFNGSPVEIEGKINNILAPNLNLTLKADDFDLNKNLRHLAPQSNLKLNGNANLLLQVTNTFDNPILTGIISSPRVSLNNIMFEQVESAVSLQNSKLKIWDFSAGLNGLKFDGYSELDFSHSERSVFFSLSSRGEISPRLLKLPSRSLEKNTSRLSIQGTGNFSQVSGKVDFQFKTLSKLDTTFQFIGDFKLGNKALLFNLKSAVNRCTAEGSILFSGKGTQYQAKFIDIHNLFYSLPEMNLFKKIFDYKTSVIQVQGEQSNWKLIGRYAWKGRISRTAYMNCRIKSKNKDVQIAADIDIDSGGENFYCNLNLIKTKESWEIKNFGIEHLFSCDGYINLNEEKQVKGTVTVTDAALDKLGRLLIRNPESIHNGNINGTINIGGTLANPYLLGKFDFNKVVISGIGLYDGGATFKLADQQFQINDFFINLNKRQILRCDGSYNFDSDLLNFYFNGIDIDVNSTVTTLFNKPRILMGDGLFKIKLYGHSNRPKLCGNINIENGKLGPFAFTHAQFDLGPEQKLDSLLNSDSLAISGIIFHNILISRAGQFEIRGDGIIPFSSQIPMNLNLRGKGNIFSLLPELTPFFKKTESKGEWTANLGGRPEDLIITGGKLELSDGNLHLASVAPEISNITANMELEQDGFLNVKFIAGKIKGREFAFRNIRSDSLLSGPPKDTFSIPEYGLNFGIFTLETSPKGIPLYIPGLMAEGEVGQFVFSGKTASEPFCFSGPLEQPVVRGKIQLQNVNFTFPFIIDNSVDTTQPNPVVEVLTHINWDITAVAGKDAHYQRNIPSGVDHVYLDLILDAGVGALDLKGVISDKTFGVTGNMESSRGNVEYLDLDFQVVKAGAEFDMDISPNQDVEFDKSSLLPIIYGEARTTVTDSTGYPYYIYLTLLTIDKETGQTLKRGRLGDVIFQLSADNPNLGYSEGELLASLGYSLSNMPKVATDLIGISTDNLLFRRLFRPFERQLERTLKLDMVRLSSRLARNLIEMKLNNEQDVQFDSRLFLLRSTKLKVGKYLAQRLFLLYTGELEAGMHYRYQQEGFGFRHTLGLEYRFNPQLLLQMEYDYDSLLLWQKEDKRIMIRHSFPF